MAWGLLNPHWICNWGQKISFAALFHHLIRLTSIPSTLENSLSLNLVWKCFFSAWATPDKFLKTEWCQQCCIFPRRSLQA
jgi:hypothetical protein